MNRKQFLFILIFIMAAESPAASYNYKVSLSKNSSDFVILLHGLRGSSRSFSNMEKALIENGYSVCRASYPSTSDSLHVMADIVLAESVRRCGENGAKTIHIVAHSMGAIMVRWFLQSHTLEKLGRVVQLSPPNNGTELVDKFRWSRLFRKINGPGGMMLGAKENGFIRALQKPDYELGVVMSSKSINPTASAFIPGKDDGRVPIAGAKIDGMKDFVLVACNHHVIMKKQATIEHALSFLKSGNF